MTADTDYLKMKYKPRKQGTGWRYGIVAVLSVAVAFLTVYALTYPANTASEQVYCGYEEHTHTDENGCFSPENELVCALTEHTHTLQCYSNPACTETPDVWTRMVEGIGLGEDIRSNVTAVAESQLGYRESTENYLVVYDETGAEENAALKGYTRYGAWYGEPYGDWSAMFCCFCLSYGGVDAEVFPCDGDVAQWIAVLSGEEINAFQSADGDVPRPGDIVFTDGDGDLVPERAGIVTELTRDEKGELTGFTAVEGDLDREVGIVTYGFSDKRIWGYGILPYESPAENKTSDEVPTFGLKSAAAAPMMASLGATPSGTAISTADGFKNMSSGNTYYLSKDITVSNTKNISGSITLNLNGHKLTATAGPLFNITAGTLTITDTGSNNDTAATQSGTPYGHGASYGSGTLTYYVTETAVTDTATGQTRETVKKHTVSTGGMLVGNKTNRAVTISGGTLNLQGGYICNFGQSDGNGGAIYVTGGTVNQSGTVIAANTAKSGGAVYITGGKLNITGGVISGNTANGSSDGGGGIMMQGSSVTVTMSAGYITNNIQTNTSSDNYWTGGGGVIIAEGARFNLSGGYVTGNYALGGGGGLKTRQSWSCSCGEAGRIYMTGGFLTANNANHAEGGGANINAGGYMEITGGYITNNILGGGVNDADFQDWGGGGLFCAEVNATIYVKNALVTDNGAGGFGGGLAGCSTGRISLVGDNGASVYDNTALGAHTSGSASTKNEDHQYALNSPVFMENGYQDYFCALSSTVSGGMLGGGTFMWKGSADGVPVTSNSKDDVLTAVSVMGLTADPSAADISAAQSLAKVYITGNESPTHGGGILANGFLIMGSTDAIETYQRLELKATKQLYNKDGLQIAPEAAAYTFRLEDEYGYTVAEATNDANGDIVFDRRLPFSQAGTFTYYLYEVQPDGGKNAGVQYDTSRYKMVVKVSKKDMGTVPGISSIKLYEYQFTNITVTEVSVTPNTEVYNGCPDNNTTHGVSFNVTGGKAFVNRMVKAEKVSVEARKVWSDGTSGKSPVQVTLYTNGVPGDTATLSASNGWKYTWSNLDSDANYTVIEMPVIGYYPDYAFKYNNVTSNVTGSSNEAKLYRKVGNFFVPLNSMEAGNQYIIASPDGDKLLCTTNAHADSGFTSADVASAKKYTGTINVNGNNYSSWYVASEVPANCIYTAKTTYSQNNTRICLKNNAVDSLLLVQSTDTGFLKGTTGEDWSSGFRINSGHLQGQTEWSSGNAWRYIIWTGAKFDTATALSNIVYTNITGSTKVITITNTPIAKTVFSFNLQKQDAEDNSIVLSGAAFNLKKNNTALKFRYVSGRYTYDTGGSVTELVTDNTGTVKVVGLPAGTYELTEIRAPEGYVLSAEPIAVTVDESTPNRTLVLAVENREINYELPETGGGGAEVFRIVGTALVVMSSVGIAAKMIHRRKRRNV